MSLSTNCNANPRPLFGIDNYHFWFYKQPINKAILESICFLEQFNFAVISSAKRFICQQEEWSNCIREPRWSMNLNVPNFWAQLNAHSHIRLREDNARARHPQRSRGCVIVFLDSFSHRFRYSSASATTILLLSHALQIRGSARFFLLFYLGHCSTRQRLNTATM